MSSMDDTSSSSSLSNSLMTGYPSSFFKILKSDDYCDKKFCPAATKIDFFYKSLLMTSSVYFWAVTESSSNGFPTKTKSSKQGSSVRCSNSLHSLTYWKETTKEIIQSELFKSFACLHCVTCIRPSIFANYVWVLNDRFGCRKSKVVPRFRQLLQCP